jgi:hypothetical protein
MHTELAAYFQNADSSHCVETRMRRVEKWNEGKVIVKCECISLSHYVFHYCYCLVCLFIIIIIILFNWSCNCFCCSCKSYLHCIHFV